jgi:hypothetical protein
MKSEHYPTPPPSSAKNDQPPPTGLGAHCAIIHAVGGTVCWLRNGLCCKFQIYVHTRVRHICWSLFCIIIVVPRSSRNIRRPQSFFAHKAHKAHKAHNTQHTTQYSTRSTHFCFKLFGTICNARRLGLSLFLGHLTQQGRARATPIDLIRSQR